MKQLWNFFYYKVVSFPAN